MRGFATIWNFFLPTRLSYVRKLAHLSLSISTPRSASCTASSRIRSAKRDESARSSSRVGKWACRRMSLPGSIIGPSIRQDCERLFLAMSDVLRATCLASLKGSTKTFPTIFGRQSEHQCRGTDLRQDRQRLYRCRRKWRCDRKVGNGAAAPCLRGRVLG